MEVRVRFAPSPTGHLHIGSLRTAIFNWLFARHNNGKFLIRIEDTDIERSKQEFTDSILETFKWMGMQPDESIIIQSQRLAEHKKLVDLLILKGKAYKCFCAKRSEDSEEAYTKYDNSCRDKIATEDDDENSFVIRFKVPKNELLKDQFVSFNDLIHGSITFPLDQFDDFVIVRSDGTPTYNFVVVADDIYMKISHVIRGEDHISNTPKQIFIYEALKAQIPYFAHVPSILNEAGQKLSKRDAATSVIEYKKQGYIADALLNYLVRLGWGHGDQEIFTREELITLFTLEHVGKSGSIFDVKKLEWLNGIYIRQKSAQEILKLIEVDVDQEFTNKFSKLTNEQILKLMDLYKDRVKTLKELSNVIVEIDKVPTVYEESSLREFVNVNTISYLEELIKRLEHTAQWNEIEISFSIKQLCKELNVKLPELTQPIRLALTGTVTSPGVFALLYILSKEESLNRLNIFIKQLKSQK